VAVEPKVPAIAANGDQTILLGANVTIDEALDDLLTRMTVTMICVPRDDGELRPVGGVELHMLIWLR
jgi:hypothetical protein